MFADLDHNSLGSAQRRPEGAHTVTVYAPSRSSRTTQTSRRTTYLELQIFFFATGLPLVDESHIWLPPA
jgi:hypothetical protein